jgi:hypothetical protein
MRQNVAKLHACTRDYLGRLFFGGEEPSHILPARQRPREHSSAAAQSGPNAAGGS